MAGKGALEQKFQQAVAAHGAGRLDEAVAGYRAVLKKDPRHAFARHYLGVACHQGGRLDEALPLLESSTERLADNAGCRLNLANLYKDLGRVAQAEKHYLAAAKLDPGMALVGFNLGQLRERSGDLAGALAAYRQSATLPQSAARLAILTADTPDASGRPDDAAALGELLTLCGYAGDDARASRVVAKLVALAAAPALTEAGGTLARNGHLGVAREALEAAVALAPDALRATCAASARLGGGPTRRWPGRMPPPTRTTRRGCGSARPMPPRNSATSRPPWRRCSGRWPSRRRGWMCSAACSSCSSACPASPPAITPLRWPTARRYAATRRGRRGWQPPLPLLGGAGGCASAS